MPWGTFYQVYEAPTLPKRELYTGTKKAINMCTYSTKYAYKYMYLQYAFYNILQHMNFES